MLLEPEKDENNDCSRSKEIRGDDCIDGQRAKEQEESSNKVTNCCCQLLQGQEKALLVPLLCYKSLQKLLRRYLKKRSDSSQQRQTD